MRNGRGGMYQGQAGEEETEIEAARIGNHKTGTWWAASLFRIFFLFFLFLFLDG